MEEDNNQIGSIVPLVYHLIDKETFMSLICGIIEYKNLKIN
jgi:hypothetical protein